MDSAHKIVDIVRNLAADNGFAEVGFTLSEKLDIEMTRYCRAMDRGDFAELEYLKRNCEKRENPALLVEGAKSIIVFLMPYGTQTQMKEEFIQLSQAQDNAVASEHYGTYKVAQYALGSDYHRVIKENLHTILTRMQEIDNSIQGRVFVDTAPVMERAWGVRSGLGFIGKNNFLISRNAGIRNFIGVIISNFETPQDVLEDCRQKAAEHTRRNFCGQCNRCIEACPTKALTPYRLDARRCTSYLTIENKQTTLQLNIERAQERENWIFGCDACMNACPWNSRNQKSRPEFLQQEFPMLHTHLKRR